MEILTRAFDWEISLKKKRVEETLGYMLSTLVKKRYNSFSIRV